jgi:hypothetical protein
MDKGKAKERKTQNQYKTNEHGEGKAYEKPTMKHDE